MSVAAPALRLGGPLTGDDAELFAALRLRACRLHPYFAAALFALLPRAAPGYGTFGVDVGWRLHIDPEVMRAWTVEEATAVLLHEVQHLVRDHHRRAHAIEEVDHRRWNLACDAAINDDLVDEGLPLPAPVLPHHIVQPTGGFEEAYYHAIVELAIDAAPAAVTGGQVTCGSGAGADPSAAELAAGGQDDPLDDHIGEIRAEVIRRTVATEALAAEARGERVARGITLWARDLTRPRIPWQRILRSAVRSSVRAVVGEPAASYARADRRSDIRPDFVFPGLVHRQASIAVVVDTSGSMHAELLDAALTEISGICARAGAARVAVLSCDTQVRAVQRVRTAAGVDLSGGGGTDLRHGVSAAAELRPRPDVIVVLTDGLTPWPDAAPGRTQLLAVIFGDRGEAPRGRGVRVCRIPADAL